MNERQRGTHVYFKMTVDDYAIVRGFMFLAGTQLRVFGISKQRRFIIINGQFKTGIFGRSKSYFWNVGIGQLDEIKIISRLVTLHFFTFSICYLNRYVFFARTIKAHSIYFENTLSQGKYGELINLFTYDAFIHAGKFLHSFRRKLTKKE